MGDTHTGSKTGLTASPKRDLQKRLLDRYSDALLWYGERPSTLVHNGDGWDGKDEKGRDIDTDCMLDQAEDCAELIMMADPKDEVILVTGTRYHDSHKGQEFTKHCAAHIKLLSLRCHGKEIKVSIRRKLKTTINGWFILETRHFIGGSSIPHGRATAALKEQLWNVMNAALDARYRDEKVQWPQLLVFSHRHYYVAAETAWGDAIVLPGWQALGGVFGDEICTGHIDLGLVRLEVGEKEVDGWGRDKKLFPAGVVRRTEHR